MNRSEETFYQVKALVARGFSDYRIAELTGISRSTALRWRHRERPPWHAELATEWEPEDIPAYCYLLGCYLGDGHTMHRPPGTWTLRVACDRRYPGIIAEVRRTMDLTFQGRTSTQFPSSTAASEVVSLCHPAIGRAFPQHGPGQKHLRPITLAHWQRELTHAHPDALIRGLIHSDGCRVVNRFRTALPSGRLATYSYIRYFFSNLSEDIRGIFSEHCRLLGIRVTQSNHRNLTVSHRESVARLERFVGPKR